MCGHVIVKRKCQIFICGVAGNVSPLQMLENDPKHDFATKTMTQASDT